MSYHETPTATGPAPDDPGMPGPDPALRELDRFVGTWEMKGRTLDSAVDNITARTTFEWLPGGHFLLQRFAADFVGMDIQSHEVIGYDPATKTFPSTVYANMARHPAAIPLGDRRRRAEDHRRDAWRNLPRPMERGRHGLLRWMATGPRP